MGIVNRERLQAEYEAPARQFAEPKEHVVSGVNDRVGGGGIASLTGLNPRVPVATDRVKVTHIWSRPHSVPDEFRRLRAQ